MTDYTNLIDKVNIPELVKALRHCISDPYGFVECDGCPIFCKGIDCQNDLHNDAAAAIEALQARLGEAENSVESWKDMYLTKHEPKRGEWKCSYPKIEPNPMFMYGICSICGFEQSISNKLNYCPNCGAKMEVQE